jgi:hypothetical protein
MQKLDDREYEAFLALGQRHSLVTLENAVPQSRVYKRIRKDLVESRWKLTAVYLMLTAVGYGVSLSICAQNGVGIMPLSFKVASSMHFIPWPWCPIVCGALFTAVPNLFSRVFFTRFQQRYLMKKLAWLISLAPVVASVSFMLSSGRHLSDYLSGLLRADFAADEWLLLWGAGAFVSVAILEAVAAFLIFRREASHRDVIAKF